MTNAEAAKLFASFPADAPALVLLIDGDTATTEVFEIDAPGTNLEEVDEEYLNEEDKQYPTIYHKY